MRTRDIQGKCLPLLGQGCMGLGGRFATDTSCDAEHVASLRLGLDLGMTLVDTAEGYGAGHSEEVVGQALQGRRDDIFVATKVGPEHLAPAALRSACEGSLRRLGLPWVDLYQIHWPNPAIPLADTLDTLLRLRQEGKFRHIGLCNASLPLVKDAHGMLGQALFSVQVEYNLCAREAELDLLPYCRAHDLAFLAYSPLDQGRVAADASMRQVLAEVGHRLAATPGQVALAWLAARGPCLPIPKAGRSHHVRENAAAGDLVLSDSDLAHLDSTCRPDLRQVPWQSIRPVADASGEHQVYRTLDEARANGHGHAPSPLALAEEILREDHIKPIRVRALARPEGDHHFELLEGRLRFWAWVLAFGDAREVPVLVRS